MVIISEIEITPVLTTNSSSVEHPLSKRRRSTTYPAAVDDDRDHISELPDTVITHILSYLYTKTSVATSVLSKRWNHLWTSVPNLDFGISVCYGLSRERLTIYLDFVDRVLSLNNVLSVRKLCLHCHQVSQRDAWMTSIAKRKFEEIDLLLYTDEMYRVPDTFFNQKCLVELKLELYTKVPQMVCFPCLEKMHLYYMRLHDGDSMKNLLSGCPVLRNLYLELHGWEDASTLYICSSTLHILHLKTKSWNEEDYFNVVIKAPNVINFHLVNVVGVSYFKVDVSSVVKLYLDYYKHDDMSLELFMSFPMFQNLINLTLEIDDGVQWQWVPHLLDCTHNLVSLTLVSGDYLPCDWYEPDEVPRCMLSCLESAKVTLLFSKDSEDMIMISYILKNANVLKKLSIHTWYEKYYTPAKERSFFFKQLSLCLCCSLVIDPACTFITLCVNEVRRKGKNNGSLHEQSWSNIKKQLKERSGLKFGRTQLEEQWNILKAKYKVWSDLMDAATECGTNSTHHTQISWNDEKWNDYVKKNPAAKQFRREGLGYTDKLKFLFASDGSTTSAQISHPSANETSKINVKVNGMENYSSDVESAQENGESESPSSTEVHSSPKNYHEQAEKQVIIPNKGETNARTTTLNEMVQKNTKSKEL